jgi:hypothetical protein
MSNDTMSFRELVLVGGVASLLLLPSACESQTTSGTNCPSYDVVPDAGVTGFSSPGEWRTDSVCAEYCKSDYPVCQLVNQTTGEMPNGM